ncbi:MAG: AAA family ATPase [Alphaproteobacteria bacterium]
MENKTNQAQPTIFQFVITGGPCAGKTTCLSVLEKSLTDKGYKVVIVPETATEVISSGIGVGDLPVQDFQEIIFDRSLNKEATTREALRKMHKDAVILYDRGIIDNKAYMSKEVFQDILFKRGLTEVDVRDQYDAVFHLVTAADGAEQFYTLANNKARSESPELARELDAKTKNAWVGHPHLRVIDNRGSFEEKIAHLEKEVLSVIGLPTPIEIERKFLIEKPCLDVLMEKEAIKQEILQVYLSSEDKNVERRVRQRGLNGIFSYYYTEKTTAEGIGRVEKERKISKSEYLELLLEGVKMIRKTRYCFLYKNQYMELDIYPNWVCNAILEVELTEETQEILLPDWISAIKEVTEDKAYKNASLASTM